MQQQKLLPDQLPHNDELPPGHSSEIRCQQADRVVIRLAYKPAVQTKKGSTEAGMGRAEQHVAGASFPLLAAEMLPEQRHVCKFRQFLHNAVCSGTVSALQALCVRKL